eukprot:7036618-Prymnesium_polylepis.1
MARKPQRAAAGKLEPLRAPIAIQPALQGIIRREPDTRCPERRSRLRFQLFTFSLTLTLYWRLNIGFERYTLPGPTQSQITRWLIADR